MATNFKLLILDYGGVYSFPYTSKNFNKIIVDTFGRLPNEEERQKIIEKSHLLGANKITTSEYISLLSTILKTSHMPSVEQFEDVTIAVTNLPSPEMVELVRTVRAQGVKVSLLSDMYLFEAQRTRPWGRYEGFDYVSLSAEAGMTKYDPGFFTNTLDYFHISPEDALFVDDVANNIAVAEVVGLATLYANKETYGHVEDLVDEIYRLLDIEASD